MEVLCSFWQFPMHDSLNCVESADVESGEDRLGSVRAKVVIRF